ncbi:MAG: SDR family oxidoreductase [Alphaproteobacteria bacterium]|jgi:NAD(P)-dependent dehydrogenase (short-subunit alcohol dehydrogenase family)|nr:SDR family oxidoreductase [Alphaproteobacteria bacterium]
MTGKARGRKSIFITGGASGIGRATAKLFHGKGWFVGAFDLNETALASLAQELGNDNCITRKLDVTDKQDYENAIAAFAAETDGRMDILYNNAGIGESGWFEDIPYEATMRLVQVNFIGVLNGIYSALPLLKATPNSLCFSTSSSSATHGMPRIAVYSATKFAVKGLTEALGIEFARHGIRVADTLPGLIDTPILRNTPNRTDGTKPTEDQLKSQTRGTFRLMPPEAVAEAVWGAYGTDKTHWYVPPELVWIDRMKVFLPRYIRGKIGKSLPGSE